MDIRITDATSDDVESIRELLRITWLATYPNEEFGITREDIQQNFDVSTPEAKERLKNRKKNININPNNHEWVVKLGDKVIGWSLAKKGEQNHIQTLYVLPEYQGQGVGGKLLARVIEWFGKAQAVYLHVASYNQKAINFYKKFGFVETGQPVKNDLQPLPSGAVIPEIEMVKRV